MKKTLFLLMLVTCSFIISCDRNDYSSLANTKWESYIDENHYCRFYFVNGKNLTISLKSGYESGTFDYDYIYSSSSGVIDIYLINPVWPNYGEHYLRHENAYLDKKKNTIQWKSTTLKLVK